MYLKIFSLAQPIKTNDPQSHLTNYRQVRTALFRSIR